MNYKNNLKELMEERNLTLAELHRISDISLTTLRELKNNPYHAFCFTTASLIAEALDCYISDLYTEDIALLFYEDVRNEMKNNILFENSQVFSPDNITLLTDLLREIGIECSFTVYGNYFKVSIKNKFGFTSILIDLNLLIEIQKEMPVLMVRDFYVCTNKNILDEDTIRKLLLQQLEDFAKKLQLKQIIVHIIADFEPEKDNFRQKYFHIETDFTYTIGTSSEIFNLLSYTPRKTLSISSQYNTWEKQL